MLAQAIEQIVRLGALEASACPCSHGGRLLEVALGERNLVARMEGGDLLWRGHAGVDVPGTTLEVGLPKQSFHVPRPRLSEFLVEEGEFSHQVGVTQGMGAREAEVGL